jgi:hypothetical protein
MCDELLEIESDCKWIFITRGILLQSLPITEELHKEIVEVRKSVLFFEQFQ